MSFSQITLELPVELLERIDHQVERIRQHDFLVSRGNIIAMLLGTALDDAEGKQRPGARHPALRRLTSPINQLVAALEAQRAESVKTRRREEESAAGLLLDAVPTLRELSLRVIRRMGDDPERRDMHVRHVVVDRAPAYFFNPCLDQACIGGHDLTKTIVAGLREQRETITATCPCEGGPAAAPCVGVLELEATARYEHSVARSDHDVTNDDAP